ncbi:disintegrin and metalloproteinase domain-containing protein 10 homolog [Amblyomma americanum]
MTACNKDKQVCVSGECVGSVCYKYGLVECFRGAGRLTEEEQCLLTCQERGSSQCKVACDFPEMKDHCGAKLPPGSPCNAMRGYCDVFSICRDVNPRPFLTSPSGFFIGGEPFTILYEFIANNPFTAGFVILGSSWMTLFVIRCFALHTPSNNPTKKPALKLKETLQSPMKAILNN